MLYLFTGILLILIISFIVSKRSKENTVDNKSGKDVSSDCCGAHEVCESESLLNSSAEVLYYDDEELDRFIDAGQNSFSDDYIEEFREVLYSLKEYEVAAWLKSLQLRRVTIPDIIKEEALMIVAERRYQKEGVE
jgi:hypothetical protein